MVGLGGSWYEPGEMSAVAVLARGQTKTVRGSVTAFCLCIIVSGSHAFQVAGRRFVSNKALQVRNQKRLDPGL